LQQQVEKLSDVHETNLCLTQQLADFAAVQLQLLEAQTENQNLHAQLAEIATLQQENAGLRARIEALAAIEGENGKLRNDIRTMHSKHSDELNGLRLDNEKLQVRTAALDRIQEENEQLLQQLRELRHAQTQVQELHTQLAEAELRSAAQVKQQLAEWHAERAQSTEQLLALEESAAQLQVAQTEAARLQAAETAQLRLVIDRFQLEGNDLRQTIKLLEADKERTSEQLSKAHELLASSSAQATELRVAHDTLCDKLVKLENSQLEHDALLTLASDELNAEKAVNSQLRQELAQRNVEAILDSHAQESEVAEAPTANEALANEKAVECADYENADTDSLPALKVPELQDDLKTIRGVGAKLEQKLNMIGICNFRDLVELEEQGYERAARLIPDLVNRIQRDGWMQQARELHRHKYNEAI
jgi:predicted flap endonuclease-1-like 5' DNA nuclease